MKKRTLGFRASSVVDLGAPSRMMLWGSILDLFGTRRRFHVMRGDPWETDARSLSRDWTAVGGDLWRSARSVSDR